MKTILSWISFTLFFLVLAVLGVAMFISYITRSMSEDRVNFNLTPEDARHEKVLVKVYKTPDRGIKIDDTTVLHVREAWIERSWCAAGWFNQNIRIRDGFVLGVLTDSTPKGFGVWQLGLNKYRTLSATSGNLFYGKIDYVPYEDTLSLLVLKWSGEGDNMGYHTIDTVKLVATR